MFTPYDWQEGIGNRASYIEGKLAHGAPVLAVSLDDGILVFTYRRTSRKICEIYDRLFAIHGWSAEQERIRAAARERDSAAMAAAVTDEMIDAMAIACRPEDLPRLAARHARPFDHLNLTAPPWGLEPEEIEAATRRIVLAQPAPTPA